MYVLFSCFLSAFVEASFFVLIFSLKGHIYVIYAVYVFLIMYVYCTVVFRFMHIRFKEVFRFKQEFYFPKMKK